MASGFGLKGGIGRCYPFFAEYKDCMQKRENETLQVCRPEREDYFECLHHNKEYARVRKINEQCKKNQEELKNPGGGGH